ncbi:MAG: hypothetical protein KJ709_02720 [Nanoarchaeota archaeon]|nr:hypothetical protein [Nanoarchaeota archaeon]
MESKFQRVYANLPEPERAQIIAIIDGRPYSWNVAHQEITNGTRLGKRILKKMEDMGIL